MLRQVSGGGKMGGEMPVCGSGCTPLGSSSFSSFSMKDLASLHFSFFFFNYEPLLSVLQKVFREVDCLLTNVLYKSGSAHKIIPTFMGFMALINSHCGSVALKCQLFHA